MKKKTLLILLALMISISVVFVGCSNDKVDTPDANDSTDDLNWPEKSIEIVVGFNPGGDTDFNARAYANYLPEVLGEPVIVTNMEGGGGSIAARDVKDANPDGYKVMMYHTALHVSEATDAIDFSYDEAYEIAAVAGLNAGNLILVSADSPYHTLEDLIEDSKARPGEITFAGNVGATTYVQAVLLNEAGASLNIVDMGGVSDRLASLQGGHVDVIPVPYGNVEDYLKVGSVRALALLEDERNHIFNDVPTAIEQGYDATFPIGYFFAFPKGTPQEIVDKFADAVEEVNGMPEYQESIENSFQQKPFFLRGGEAKEWMDDQRDMIMDLKDKL